MRLQIPFAYNLWFHFLRFTLFCDADDDAQASCVLGKSPTWRSSLNSLVILDLEIRTHEVAEAGSELTIPLPQPAP